MAHESGGSKKRKYEEDGAVFKYGPSFVHLKAFGETVAIHEDLFFSYVKESDLLVNKVMTKQGQPKVYNYWYSAPSVLRALAHWMYRGELPSEDLIERLLSSNRSAGSLGEESLACSMAYGLSQLACQMRIRKLQNDTLDYLFITYLKRGTLPSLERVHRIFTDLLLPDHQLCSFCIDIYYKKSGISSAEGTPSTSGWYSIHDDDRFPAAFLYGIFLRHCWVNRNYSQQGTGKAPVSAPSNESDTLPQSSGNGDAAAPIKWIMRLCDYHVKDDPLGENDVLESCG